MRLDDARLCLDCEEIHEAQECPVCLSEAFVYLMRWVPVEERRTRRLPSATKVVPEKKGVGRWVQRGVVGLAVMAASRRHGPSEAFGAGHGSESGGEEKRP